MNEWSEKEAHNVLAETAAVIRVATRHVSKLLAEADDLESLQSSVEKLNDLVTSLSPDEISTSRSTPWITRGDAREIIALSKRLLKLADLSGIVRLSTDLTTQARTFLEMMSKFSMRTGGIGGEVDVEDYLTTDQILTLMEWVEEGKLRKTEVSSE